MKIEQGNNNKMLFVFDYCLVEKVRSSDCLVSFFSSSSSSLFCFITIINSFLRFYFSLYVCLSLSLSASVSVSPWNNNRSNHKGNTLNSCDEGGLAMQLCLEREKQCEKSVFICG